MSSDGGGSRVSLCNVLREGKGTRGRKREIVGRSRLSGLCVCVCVFGLVPNKGNNTFNMHHGPKSLNSREMVVFSSKHFHNLE